MNDIILILKIGNGGVNQQSMWRRSTITTERQLPLLILGGIDDYHGEDQQSTLTFT